MIYAIAAYETDPGRVAAVNDVEVGVLDDASFKPLAPLPEGVVGANVTGVAQNKGSKNDYHFHILLGGGAVYHIVSEMMKPVEREEWELVTE